MAFMQRKAKLYLSFHFVETENCRRSCITYLLQAVYLYLFRRMKTKRARCRDSRHPGLKHEMD